jgi:hypothetical protein
MIIKNFYNGYIDLKVEKIEEINKKIAELENEISQDTDTINFTEYYDDYGNTLVQENTLEEIYHSAYMQDLRKEFLAGNGNRIRLLTAGTGARPDADLRPVTLFGHQFRQDLLV